MATVSIADNPERRRYEASNPDGEVAGFAEYIRTEELVVFTHTEVARAYEGQGVGSALAAGALDHVRSLGLAVIPMCPFIRSYIERHREYADLVYSAKPSSVHD
ncbi:GNAT family N-acetyltransferase [Actinopolymorpha alba]|uniref:GNAT family N-acetyltransferase n=1 Tax=Actinopolymorpha alba TaxID=533267 RepID=UPI000367F2EE|nr:GNAT family N-acetyltransferase [Actinopolymorpha alba]